MNGCLIPNQKEAVKLWMKYILLLGRFYDPDDRRNSLRDALNTYFSEMEGTFVSSNSLEFKTFLESKVGSIRFMKPIAMNTKQGKTLIFVDGRIEDL